MHHELVWQGSFGQHLETLFADAQEIIIISAFATRSGIDEIRDEIIKCTKRGGTVRLVLGIDRMIANHQMISALAKLQDECGEGLRVSLHIETADAFLHAKVFAASKAASTHVLVGSFNLTSKGFHHNHELAAQLTGGPELFTELRKFINSMDLRDFDKSMEATLALSLNRKKGPISPEEAASRKKAAEDRLRKLQQILALKTSPIDVSQSERFLSDLLDAGNFYTYEFDLEKLAVPSGLNDLYEQGILAREKSTSAGTANVKTAMRISASFPLVPPHIQTRYARYAKRIGRLFSSLGFETPYGYWIPNTYLPQLTKVTEEIAHEVAGIEGVDHGVRELIAKHLKELDNTIEQVAERVRRVGFLPPSQWKNVRDKNLSAIRARYCKSSDQDYQQPDVQEAILAAVKAKLMAVRAKLGCVSIGCVSIIV